MYKMENINEEEKFQKYNLLLWSFINRKVPSYNFSCVSWKKRGLKIRKSTKKLLFQ